MHVFYKLFICADIWDEVKLQCSVHYNATHAPIWPVLKPDFSIAISLACNYTDFHRHTTCPPTCTFNIEVVLFCRQFSHINQVPILLADAIRTLEMSDCLPSRYSSRSLASRR